MLMGLGIGIVAVAALLTFYSPYAGLLFYWAWFLVRPQEFIEGLGGTLPLERILVIVLLLSFLLKHKIRDQQTLVSSPVTFALVLFLMANYLTIITSVWAGQSLQTSNDLAKLCIFYFVATNLLNTETRLQRFIWIYALGAVWMASSSIYSYITDPYYAQGIQRATGVTSTWGDPNATAINLSLALPFTLVLFSTRPKWPVKMILASFIVLFMACVVLTGSRTGMVILALILLLMALRSRKRLVLIGVSVAALSVAWVTMPPEYQERYSSITELFSPPKEGETGSKESAQMSAHGRVVGWEVALSMFASRPILGVGAGAFPAAFFSGEFTYHGTKGWFQPHNMPGQLLSELGLVGTSAFLYYIYIIVLQKRRTTGMLKDVGRDDTRMFVNQLNHAVITCMIALFISGFSSHNLYRYNWYLIGAFAVVAGRLATAAPNPTEAAKEEVHSSEPLRPYYSHANS